LAWLRFARSQWEIAVVAFCCIGSFCRPENAAALITIGRSGVPEQEWSGYGPLKARCEIALKEIMPDRAAVVRPAVIVGPGGASDRFTYWVQRVDRGGEVLAPGRPEDPTQFIDVRDLAEWMIRLAEERTFGTFNATGPGSPLSVAELRFDLNSQLFTNVKVTITTSRQTLTPPHTVTPDPGEWTIDATSPPSVVFSRPQLPAGGATVSFKVGFTSSAPATVLFTYRIEAAQLVEPVDLVQLITVT